MVIRGVNRLGAALRGATQYKAEYKNLVKLGLPVMVTQLGVIVVSFADTMMVARCGTSELAAAAFVNSIFMVAIVMLFGFAAGITPLVGALFSKGDHKGVGGMLKAGFYTNVMLACVFVAVLSVVYMFVDRMGQDPALMPLVRPYYLVVLCTLVPMAIFNSFQQTSNGCTDTVTPMCFIIASNVLNIFGNWLLIGGELGCPKLGLLGAGISTLIARFFAMAGIVITYLVSRKRRPYMDGWRAAQGEEHRQRCREVWVTSYPIMIQSGIECFLWSFGGVVSGWYGKVQLASYQVVNTIAQLGFMVYMGFGVATSIRVANYVGLNDFRGVRRITTAGLHIILVLATVSSLGFWVFFHPLVALFTPDTAVQLAAVPLLVPLILYQYGDAVQLCYANALRGTARVKPLLWAAVVAYLCVGCPVIYLFAEVLGYHNVGVYYSFTIALMIAATLLWWFYRRAVKWLEKKHAEGQMPATER